MPTEKKIVPMTADDVTHLFRSTEKSRVGTRGHTLHEESFKCLLASLAHFKKAESPSPAPQSSSELHSSSPCLPETPFYPFYTEDSLKKRYQDAIASLTERPLAGTPALNLLSEYVNLGAVIPADKLDSIIRHIHTAEILYMRGDKKLILNNEARGFVRGYLAAKGFQNYV